jgi:formylglycine-generating enzyme required for sulfatase activity
LFDMHGNVKEITTTFQGVFIERGGQTSETALRARSAWRIPVEKASETHHRRGFRVAVLAGHSPKPAVAPFDAAAATAHQEAWAEHLGVPTEFTNTSGMTFRFIPPGRARLGTADQQLTAALAGMKDHAWAHARVREEGPAVAVDVPAGYYMGIHEVTQGQFKQFVDATKYITVAEADPQGGEIHNVTANKPERKPEYTWRNATFTLGPNHPVGFLTLADAKAFCAWLSRRDGVTYAIPTDSQWEYACRAGTETLWPSGDDPALAGAADWVYGRHPVGGRRPNGFGLFDMNGNAAEFVMAKAGPRLRGGAHAPSVWFLRSASWAPDNGAPGEWYGLRVVVVGDLHKVAEIEPKKTVIPKPADAPFDAAAAKAHQFAWATHLGVPVEFTNSIGVKFRLIPPGKFTVGATAADMERLLRTVPKDPPWIADNIKQAEPAHTVVIAAPFYLGAYEVTNRQYAAFADRTSYQTVDEKNGLGGERYDGAPGIARKPEFNWRAVSKKYGATYPVTYMLPADAEAFCAWLTREEGLEYGLPTEEQWEYACRAGTTGDRFCPDDRLDDYFDFARARKYDIGPVGEKLPNPFGLYDILGNQEEMARGREGVVLRGGSSGADAACLDERCAGRRQLWNGGKVSAYFQGFRVAITGDLRKAATFTAKPPAAPATAVAPFAADKAKEYQAAWARYLGVEPEITNSVGMKLRLIPPGEFQMGSTPEQIQLVLKHVADYGVSHVKREGPTRPVRLAKPYYLGTCEVTVGQFRKFAEKTGYKTRPETDGVGSLGYKGDKLEVSKEFTWRNPQFTTSEALPVVCIDFEDAKAFCEWLSRTEGRQYEIPHESAWEYACRAGTTGFWYWGDQSEGWEAYLRKGKHPVGEMPPNAFGLHDMLGNVHEFARADASPFVFRGGAGGWNVWEARSATRAEFSGTHFKSGFEGGFRVALVGDLKPPSKK